MARSSVTADMRVLTVIVLSATVAFTACTSQDPESVPEGETNSTTDVGTATTAVTTLEGETQSATTTPTASTPTTSTTEASDPATTTSSATAPDLEEELEDLDELGELLDDLDDLLSGI